ncbi:MAG: hypothetical protein L3J78_01615 [Thermoplasmata archaeon]|nr:hypothetical protein [Thermoplasmata archaeon]
MAGLKVRNAFSLGPMTRNAPPNEDSIDSLQDGGITWLFYFWRTQVPEQELSRIARSERAGFLRAAVTFGFPDREAHLYRSTITVHLWELGDAYARGFRPPDDDWSRFLLHIFTHEPLHHAIGRCLAEIFEWGDQEWVISRLGDARWW